MTKRLQEMLLSINSGPEFNKAQLRTRGIKATTPAQVQALAVIRRARHVPTKDIRDYGMSGLALRAYYALQQEVANV